jgi:hypothetical protein
MSASLNSYIHRVPAYYMRILIILICCILSGCGSGSPYSYKKVSGKIAYDDGSPIPASALRIRFTALDAPEVANAHPRPAFAVVNTDGSFECATSYKYGDGLIAGRHKVSIEREGLPDTTKPLVPKEYLSSNTTPIEVDTKDSPFEIKVPKPKGNR